MVPWTNVKPLPSICTALLPFLLFGGLSVFGHPVPDIPVRATFLEDGTATIAVEIDPRCFADQALHEPYLENAVLQSRSEKEKAALVTKAQAFISDTLTFRLEPQKALKPTFAMRFTTLGSEPLLWNAEEPDSNRQRVARLPVTITATWKLDASALKTYQLHAKPDGKFSVQFINHIGDDAQRLHVLFPGETSYRLELSKALEK